MDNNQDIKAARAVLEIEIEGLKALTKTIDGKFTSAVDTLYNLKGRIIVSGMGKSGHIANKIAATLSSTGSPALFVHPAEASHGDLGMITENDAVILLSNSGETSELSDIIHYTRRFSIPLIAIVRREKSFLVDSADIAFVLPEVPEASPIGAPTTSTTMMLAWGDALAMALLQRRGFGKEDFSELHPGGKLGRTLAKAGQLMRMGEAIPYVSPDTPMSEVLLTITQKSLGCAVVINEHDKAVGIITDGDLRRHMGDAILSQTAEEVMTANPKTISENSLAVEAVNIMNTYSITSLCVVDDEQCFRGIIHIHDILQAGVV